MKKFYFFLLSLLTFYSNGQVAGGNCNNVGFENGTTNNWILQNGNITGTHLPCDNCPNANGAIATVVSSTSTIGSQCTNGVDNYGGFPVLAPSPLGGNYSLLLNDNSAGGKIQQVSFKSVVSNESPLSNIQFAAVLQKGNLADSVAPYFSVAVWDKHTNSIISCTQYNSNMNTITGWQMSSLDPTIYYLPWQAVSLDLSAEMNDSVEVVFTVSGGSDGNSFGYAYINANCFPSQIKANPALCSGGGPAILHGPPGFVAYNWSGPVTGNADSLITSIPGNYTLTTTPKTGGCPPPYLYFNLTLNTAPSASYALVQDTAPHRWDVYPVYPPSTAQHTWNWGDGSPLDTSAYPSHTYSVAGSYSICVTAKNSNGCSSTYCQDDSVYRLAYNNILSNMIYVNVMQNKQTTVINELSLSDRHLIVYPNPANDYLNMLTTEMQGTIKIMDVLGNEIKSEEVNGILRLDISNLNKGIYFLRFFTNNLIYTTKFQKK